MKNKFFFLFVLIVSTLFFQDVFAENAGFEAFVSEQQKDGTTSYSVTIQALAFSALLAFLPAIVLMMTSFARIVIVLAILRQALGTMQTPSNQILIGIALFLSVFIMQPTLQKVYDDGVEPYLNNKIEISEAINKSSVPMRDFMLSNTRQTDLAMFLNMSSLGEVEKREDLPMYILIPAFITSELKTAFQIGFMIFIPFVVIDLVVASVLMSMGMMMLSPMMISLPFKLMLFVLVDGWLLVIQTITSSFKPLTGG